MSAMDKDQRRLVMQGAVIWSVGGALIGALLGQSLTAFISSAIIGLVIGTLGWYYGGPFGGTLVSATGALWAIAGGLAGDFFSAGLTGAVITGTLGLSLGIIGWQKRDTTDGALLGDTLGGMLGAMIGGGIFIGALELSTRLDIDGWVLIPIVLISLFAAILSPLGGLIWGRRTSERAVDRAEQADS